MNLIWHGTASIEMVSESGRILFDPFIPLRGVDVPVSVEDYDGFTDIIVTHGHFDHIASLPSIVKRNPQSLVYCTQTPYNTLLKKGLSEKNLKQIRFGESLEVNGFSIQVFHGRHAVLPKASMQRISYAIKHPARGNLLYMLRESLMCRENDETVIYQIEADGKTVMLLGSMNIRDEEEYPAGADLLVLPYNGWEDNFPPAVRIIERLQPKRVVLDHYDDTFPPLTMPVDLAPILDRYGEKVTALELGKAVIV